MNTNELNEKIAKIKNDLVEVSMEVKSRSIVYEKPNQLQASQFGVVSVPRTKVETNTTKEKYGLDTVADMLHDICKDKGYTVDFMKQYEKISKQLNSSEFELSPSEQSYANMRKRLGASYQLYSSEKIREAYELLREQFSILAIAFSNFMGYIEKNNIDPSYTYKSECSFENYDEKLVTTKIVPNCYEVLTTTIADCYDLVKDDYYDEKMCK